MSTPSHLLTMGTALGYAEDQKFYVEVLVGGQWMGGRVLAKDGQGVVLRTGSYTHAIRLEHVQAVRFKHEDEEFALERSAR